MSITDELLEGDRTHSDAAVIPHVFDRPTRISQDELAEIVGAVRSIARQISEEVSGYHHRALDAVLTARTDEAAKRAVPDLLAELADLGLSWRDIARLVGVTVPAIRKWRNGEPATGVNRRAVAKLLAFVDILQSDHLVQEPASWLEMPMGPSSITGLDIYAAGRCDLLIAHAESHLTSEQLLDEFDSGWRNSIDDRFEIFTAQDGEAAIRLRTDSLA